MGDPFDLDQQDAANEAREVTARLETKTENDDFLWLMSSKRGRRVVWRMLQKAGVYRVSFTPDALQTAFNEGGRNVGLQLTAQIFELCPERFAEMAAEAKEKDR